MYKVSPRREEEKYTMYKVSSRREEGYPAQEKSLCWRGLAVRANRYPAKRHGLQARASEPKSRNPSSLRGGTTKQSQCASEIASFLAMTVLIHSS
jgi:hypothetical protein